ncbi:MAG: ABC transporter substrate-binding protein [Caldilineaceae bacterium]|nr:ABC transporter substrate-binding protein [Caldilineaceae bacterium]
MNPDPYRTLRFQHRHAILLTVGVIFFLFVTSCATLAPATEESGASLESDTAAPTMVRIGWKGAPDTLNPGMAFLTDSYTIFNLVYDTMYELTMENTFSLSLATAVETSPDGLVWTYTIRDDAQWHDGEPLTAADVAFTYNFYHDHVDFPYLPTYTEHFVSIEAPDPTTVVITLDEAIPNMEAQLVFLYVLPAHIWREQLAGNDYAEFQNLAMIGSGPFKLVGYAQNEYVHLAANRSYFGQQATVDEVIFQSFGNADTLVQAMQTGQVDMITELPKTAIPTLRDAPNIQLVTGPPLAAEVSDIFFNQIDPAHCPTADGGLCTGHPALRDRSVRQALAHATDKQEIIDLLLLGLGTPGLTLLPDSLTYWYNTELTDYAFDLARANQLLDEAGYVDRDGDGIREMPDGTNPLRFRLYWADDTPDAPRMAELLAQNWRQIGITVDAQTYDPDALLALCCPAFDYDIIIWGWQMDPDPNLLLSVMTSDLIPYGSSEAGYANPVYDALYAQQTVELDPEKRRELVWEMQRIVLEDVVYIVPYYAQFAQAYRTDRFTGWITDAPTLTLEDQSSLVSLTPVE